MLLAALAASLALNAVFIIILARRDGYLVRAEEDDEQLNENEQFAISEAIRTDPRRL